MKRSAAARRRRQIAIVSSLTGYHGMPTCPSYSASKAFVKAWGAGLLVSLVGRGIYVNVICPGFVRSRITDRNTCQTPYFMEAESAADLIIALLSRNIGLIAFPWPMRLACGPSPRSPNASPPGSSPACPRRRKSAGLRLDKGAPYRERDPNTRAATALDTNA